MIIRMTLDLPAESAYVRLVRNMAEALLLDMGVVREDVDDVELIVGEVCSNAVRHAYDYPGERYQVELGFSVDRASIVVRDFGKGANPEKFLNDPMELREGGRGMMIVQALADRFDFHVQNGTTISADVELHYRTQDDAARAAAMDGHGLQATIQGAPPADRAALPGTGLPDVTATPDSALPYPGASPPLGG